MGPLKDSPGPLLNVLHAVQDAFGYVPASAVPLIATELNLSRAEVQGVVSFYHYFREHPAGRKVVRVCRAESCQAVGGEQLATHIARRVHLDYGQTSGNGTLTLESVYCLGLCSLSPAVMIDDDVHGRVTPERFDALLAEGEHP